MWVIVLCLLSNLEKGIYSLQSEKFPKLKNKPNMFTFKPVGCRREGC